MEIQGQLIKIFEPVTGTGRTGQQWKRQDLLIEVQGQFPKKICFSVNSDKTPIDSLKIGDMITVSINIESREYNGRWFTDIRAWKIDIGAAAQANPTEVQGTIIETLQPMSGTSKAGKTWKRQDYVLETQDQFPRKVCFSVWADRINPSNLQNGNFVTVTVDIESREGSNGGWFTSVQAWKAIQGAAPSANTAKNNTYGVESQNPDITAISPDQIKAQDDGEDLPF